MIMCGMLYIYAFKGVCRCVSVCVCVFTSGCNEVRMGGFLLFEEWERGMRAGNEGESK